jgi:hypothetical protein
MEVKDHTDGHIGAEGLTDGADDLAFQVGIAVSGAGAVERQSNGIQRLFRMQLYTSSYFFFGCGFFFFFATEKPKVPIFLPSSK